MRDGGNLLGVSTLRGEFADNAEWRDDPARAAIVVGTVDMVGSRLLFSGYGCGFKSKPLHAGFLGQDSLIVHDEAHLEPAFQNLITSLEKKQRRCGAARPLRVLELTATSRDGGRGSFSLDDLEDRLRAKKGIAFHPVEDEKKLEAEALGSRWIFRDSRQAILICLPPILRKMNAPAATIAASPRNTPTR